MFGRIKQAGAKGARLEVTQMLTIKNMEDPVGTAETFVVKTAASPISGPGHFLKDRVSKRHSPV